MRKTTLIATLLFASGAPALAQSNSNQVTDKAVNELIARGNVDEIIDSGVAMLNGVGAGKDEIRGVKLLRMGAETGNPRAAVAMSNVYATGAGNIEKSVLAQALLLYYAYKHGRPDLKDQVGQAARAIPENQRNTFRIYGAVIAGNSNPMNTIDVVTKRLNAEGEQPDKSAAAPHADKVWTDPTTGLTWMRCEVGVAPSTNLRLGDARCQWPNPQEMAWHDAVLQANSIEYAGEKDWRVPTFDEVKTIQKCSFPKRPGTVTKPPANLIIVNGEWECPKGSEGPDFPEEVGFKRLWTISLAADSMAGASDYDMNKFRTTKARVAIVAGVRGIEPTRTLPAVFVRGGQPTSGWSAAIADAKLLQQGINTERIAEQQKNEKLHEKYVAEDKRSREARNEAYRAAVEKCGAEQRRIESNVKQGDKVRQGMVIGFQGELVLVQTYKTECQGLRRPDGSCNVFDLKRVAAGNELFRRSDLKAVCDIPAQ